MMISADFVLSINENIRIRNRANVVIIGKSTLLKDIENQLINSTSNIKKFEQVEDFITQSIFDNLRFDFILLSYEKIKDLNSTQFLKKIINVTTPDAFIFICGKFFDKWYLSKKINLLEIIKVSRLKNLNFSITTDSDHNFVILLRKIAFNQNKALHIYFSEMNKNIYGREK